jgi:16S rRNA (guanine966-N2)-methyltransferase
MRIIGGQFRGKRLAAPGASGGGTAHLRPTSDRVREALFNLLAHGDYGDPPPPEGRRVLDLFAGTGALGLEALSRGAAHATFLDNDATAIRLIGENLRKLGETSTAKVVRADATRPPPGREPCDLVFLDPPYRSGQAAPALSALAAGWVAPDAIVTVELAHNEDVVPPDGFEAIDERRYGAAKIVILRGKP